MSTFSIGSATLLVPDHGGRELQITDFGSETHDAWEMSAVVAAPDGPREVVYQPWAHGKRLLVRAFDPSACEGS